jgi:8-oxo-dGTP pyrophosphatase MutT (NUDIX family)
VYAAKSKKALFIFRRGKWDLPKGKLDEGESIETCAIREIKEETGIEGIKIVKPLIITYHTYHQDKEFILKESHWYLVKANKEEATHPQEDEGIDDCKWVAKDELEQYLTGSYALIRDVTEKALEAIG